MAIPGHAGSILFVDLTEGKTRREPLDWEAARLLLGGYGLNNKLLYDLVPPGLPSLAPESAIILGTGPFPGTMVPGSSRVMATFKAPLGETISLNSGGGHFASMLKSAGYDHIVITGQAPCPVYVMVADEGVQIADARSLWGRDMFETIDELRCRYEPCSVIPIGPAGENLVNISVTTVDKGGGSIGEGGLPAVMGSKNLKAIVAVQGHHETRVADRRRLHRLVDRDLQRVVDYHMRDEMMKGGMMTMTAGWRPGGGRIVRNWTELEPTPPEAVALAAAMYEIHKHSRKKIACPSCPMSDKDRIDITEGEYAPLTSYYTALIARRSFGARNAADAYSRNLKYADALDRYGICASQFDPMLLLMVHLYEQGLITREDTGGLELKDDFETAMKLLRMIAYGEGFGAVMAEGVVGALRKLGRGLEKHAVHIKGSARIWDPRMGGLGTMEFCQMTNPRGAHIMAGAIGPPTYQPGFKVEEWIRQAQRQGTPEEVIKRVFGPDSLNMGRLLPYAEHWYSLFNCLGLCHRLYISRFHSAHTLAEYYAAVTGIETTGAELLKGAERAWNLWKLLSVREGFARKDDAPPEVWFTPIKGPGGAAYPLMDYFKKTRLSREDVEMLLTEYYDERGWDKETGIPTPAKLRELGLEGLVSPQAIPKPF